MKPIAIFLLMVAACAAQAQPAKSFVGTVAGLRPESAEVVIRPDTGDPVVARFTPDTIAQKIAPGEKDLKNAQSIQVSEVAAGDRVLVTLEPGTPNVRRIVVMSAGDIARHNEADRLDWQKRGVAGIVSAKAGNRITVKTRTPTGEAEAVVIADEKTSFKRYAPDSVKFGEAKPSKAAEVSVGDQLRARGEKSEDGLKVTAQEVVFGTFLLKAGSITAVNPESKELTVRELGSNTRLTVVLTVDSQIRQMLGFPAGMPGGGGRGGMPPIGGRSTNPGAGNRGGLTGGPPGGNLDINQMVESMPVVKLEDLKPGDTVVISSTKGAKSDQLTAIMVLSNADMLIQMASMMSGANRGGVNDVGWNGMLGGDLGALGGLGLSGMIQ
jgi:hypothetical protein